MSLWTCSTPVTSSQPIRCETKSPSPRQDEKRNGFHTSRRIRRSQSENVQSVMRYQISKEGQRDSKTILQKHVQHESFLHVLRNTASTTNAKFRAFRSTNHVLNTVEMSKLSVCARRQALYTRRRRAHSCVRAPLHREWRLTFRVNTTRPL